MASIRDLTCIHSVAHMAECGKYEEEFIVYGCSCMENGKLVYRISPSEQEIFRFQEKAALENQPTSPMHTRMNRCIVQTGQHEQRLYETEIGLANTLQTLYPHLFFEQLGCCTNAPFTDTAREIFDELRTQLNGIFSADYLQLLQGLVSMAYQAHVLTPAALSEIQQWQKTIQQQMEHDVLITKPFKRTFYGICYFNQNEVPQYKVNAQKFVVLHEQRALKRRRYPVTPIFQKTYWYDYGVEPKEVKELFKKQLKQYYDESYWQYWRQIKALAAVVEKEQFQQALQMIEQTGVQEQRDAFLEYGYDWNVVMLEHEHFAKIDAQ